YTAGTLIKSARVMKERGATGIDVFATHGYLNDPAIERLKTAHDEGIIDRIILTDSIKLSEEKKERIIEADLDILFIPTSVLFADVIARTQRNITLSPIYAETTYLENLYKGIHLMQIEDLP
ncbi:MAG: hypothetical protein ACOC32_00190, partial [Nanoarchaeota archaeon]